MTMLAESTAEAPQELYAEAPPELDGALDQAPEEQHEPDLAAQFAELKAAHDALVAERAAEKNSQLEAATQAQQQQHMAAYGQWSEAMKASLENVSTYLTEDQKQILGPAVEMAPIGAYVMSEDYKNRMAAFRERIANAERKTLAWDLTEQHMGTATVTAARQFQEKLLVYQDPQLMRQAAEVLARDVRSGNIASGMGTAGARVPSGVGGFTGNATTPWDRYQKALREGGPLPPKHEIDAMMRARYGIQ